MIDEQALATLKRDVGDDMFPMILEQFGVELHGKIELLNEACRQADVAQLAELAHSLKSTTRTLGLNGVADLAAQVEQRGRAGDNSVVDDIGELVGLCEQAAELIDQRVAASR